MQDLHLCSLRYRTSRGLSKWWLKPSMGGLFCSLSPTFSEKAKGISVPVGLDQILFLISYLFCCVILRSLFTFWCNVWIVKSDGFCFIIFFNKIFLTVFVIFVYKNESPWIVEKGGIEIFYSKLKYLTEKCLCMTFGMEKNIQVTLQFLWVVNKSEFACVLQWKPFCFHAFFLKNPLRMLQGERKKGTIVYPWKRL